MIKGGKLTVTSIRQVAHKMSKKIVFVEDLWTFIDDIYSFLREVQRAECAATTKKKTKNKTLRQILN